MTETTTEGADGNAQSLEQARERLLEAAMMHVPFDGWSEATFRAAIRDTGLAVGTARAACPRGAVDLAVAFHEAGDHAMIRRLRAEDLSSLRFRDRIATAIRYRIEAAEDKEAVRRGTTLFALPQYAPEGARLIWGTADRIWTTLGDRSDDYNWYTKRASLAGVYASTVLYWLGDESDGSTATWEFLDRRIGEVMQVEKVKAQVQENPILKRALAGPAWLLGQIRPPRTDPMDDLPGRWPSRPAAPGDAG